MISFLIPALNEEQNIQSCIDSIKASVASVPAFEIIVGDHGSSDRTAALAAAAGARVVHHQKGTTIASLRNFLVESSSGEIVVFLDADVRLTGDWAQNIDAAIASLELNPQWITGSWCEPPPIKNPFIDAWFAVMPTRNRNYLGTGHIIFTRALFDRVGGFDPVLRTGEDYDFCTRAVSIAQAHIASNPALKVVHYDYPLSMASFVRRERWHGSGDFQSLGNILKSKIALITILFILLHGVLLLGLIGSGVLATLAVLGIATLVSLLSVYRFPALPNDRRLPNIGIFYLYFLGRSLSFFSQFPFPWRRR